MRDMAIIANYRQQFPKETASFPVSIDLPVSAT
jgi:hypothetical protein